MSTVVTDLMAKMSKYQTRELVTEAKILRQPKLYVKKRKKR